MFYNIRIKSSGSEFSLESSDKEIMQREIDIYFARFLGINNPYENENKIRTKNYNLKSIYDVENKAPQQEIVINTPQAKISENHTQKTSEQITIQNQQILQQQYSQQIPTQQYVQETVAPQQNQQVETIQYVQETVAPQLNQQVETIQYVQETVAPQLNQQVESIQQTNEQVIISQNNQQIDLAQNQFMQQPQEEIKIETNIAPKIAMDIQEQNIQETKTQNQTITQANIIQEFTKEAQEQANVQNLKRIFEQSAPDINNIKIEPYNLEHLQKPTENQTPVEQNNMQQALNNANQISKQLIEEPIYQGMPQVAKEAPTINVVEQTAEKQTETNEPKKSSVEIEEMIIKAQKELDLIILDDNNSDTDQEEIISLDKEDVILNNDTINQQEILNDIFSNDSNNMLNINKENTDEFFPQVKGDEISAPKSEQTPNLIVNPSTTKFPDLKSFISELNNINTIQDNFIVCAYYIKKALNQEYFTIKFINSKLFQTTGNIADMSIIDEFIKKEYISSKDIDGSRQYTLTIAGEEYFACTFQG